MKKTMQKSIGVLLSLIMLLSVFAGQPVFAEPAVLASGEVGAEGDNIIWTLMRDNVLILSGSGATVDYSTSPGYDEPGRRGPWWYTEYRDRVETVVVEEGITYLGKYLFASNGSLKHADLPDSLEGLGEGVFEFCDLQELPNLGKVTAIPRSAFESCPLTETLIIPEGITKLGNSCFKESRTKHLVLPSTMRDASEWYQFYGCPLETVEQPASFIMAPDFEYERLSKLTLYGDAWEFPHGRFMFLNPNTEVVIPEGSSYKGFTGLYPAVHTPWEGTWYDWQWYREELMCFNEEAMGDYDSPEAQAEDAHSSFDWNFRNENHARLVEVDNPAEDPIVPDENGKYYNVFGEATVTIALSYTLVPAKAPTAEENGNIEYYEGSDGKLYVKDGDEYVVTAEKDVLIPYFVFDEGGQQLTGYNGLDTEIVLPETIPDNYPDEALRGRSYGIIMDDAFAGNAALTKVTMGDNIYHIGVRAFRNCTNLREIYIGEGLEIIQWGAFDGCDSLSVIFCTSSIPFDNDHYYNNASLDDTEAMKVYCVKDSFLDEAGYYENIYYIYLPMTEAKDATCTEDGNIAYYVGAQDENVVYYDENGEPISYDDILIEGGHIWGDGDWTEATFADCGNDGVLPHFTCERCGHFFDVEGTEMDSVVDPATGDHDWEWIVNEEPGCYTEGKKHQYCSVCEQTQNENTPIPAVHEFDAWADAVAPTCGKDGTVGYQHCHVCGDNFDADGNKLDSIVAPATGNHTISTMNAKEATATEDGYTGDEVCSVCGKTIKTGEVIPATGETTPDEPDGGDACPFCGKVHTGRHAKWIKILHLVLAFLLNVFRIIKK